MPGSFTAAQRSAAEWRRKDACVMAGPGSGKTTVLVERYRSLIRDHGFEPREILAITFTEKAAANMKGRVAARFQGDPATLRELESAWISTIHGFCGRLLRENAIAAGLDPRFTVLDQRESDELQFEAIDAALDEFVATRRPEAIELIETLQNARIAGDLKDAYDAIRSAGLTVADVRAMPSPIPHADEKALRDVLHGALAAWPATLSAVQREQYAELRQWASDFRLEFGLKPPINLRRTPREQSDAMNRFRDVYNACATGRHVARFRAMIFEVFERFEALYAQRKTELRALDFNDLERRAVGLLESDRAVRDRVRAQFRQVMLDEFQDINEQQWKLIELVRAPDVFFGVGDINQSIYGFRHARPHIFTRYRDSTVTEGKHFVELAENFRSREEILRTVEAALNGEKGIEARGLVAAADFRPKTGPAVEVLRIEAEDEERDESAAREARWIAHRILSMHVSQGGARQFADFAILCRNGESMRPILDALGHANIPYVCGRRESFLVSREGLDITALLRAIANPRDSISLVTVLRSPLVGIGDESLLRLRLVAHSVTGGLNLCAHEPERLESFDPRDAEILRRFSRNLKRWRAEQPVLALDLLIARALKDCGFDWNANVESYLQAARSRGGGRDLLKFLREVESLENAIGTESDLSDRDQGDRVQVMTAHGAKGLEFPVVIIAAMDKGTRTGVSSISFTPDHGLGVTWKGPDGKEREDSWQTANKAVAEEREKDEANRLLYVAMTRAAEHLILSYSRGKRSSRWIKIVESLSAVKPFAATADPDDLRFDSRIEEAAPAPVPPVAPAGRHDTAVNVTSLAVFAQCPRRYYIGRYLGWDAPGRGEANGHASGTSSSGTSSSGPTASELGVMVHEILAGGAGEYPSEAHRLAAVFRESDLGARAAAAARSEREWDFICDMDGALVRGKIDLWFEEGGQLRIVDYKTDAHVETEAYRSQLALYAIALEKATGKRPERAWLHFLRADRLIEIDLDDALLAESRALIGRLLECQDALRFELNTGPHCRSCGFYRQHCPAIIESSQ